MKGILMKPDIWQAKLRVLEQYGEAQTRRVIKIPKYGRIKDGRLTNDGAIMICFDQSGLADWKKLYPRYHAGETVYIKEAYYIIGTFRPDHIGFDDRVQIKYSPDGAITWVHKPRNKPIQLIGYHSPLMMPEWAARHFLKILAVRAERVQGISVADAIAEGCQIDSKCLNRLLPSLPIQKFKEVWDSINPKYPFEGNPWVFPYTFMLKGEDEN